MSVVDVNRIEDEWNEWWVGDEWWAGDESVYMTIFKGGVPGAIEDNKDNKWDNKDNKPYSNEK